VHQWKYEESEGRVDEVPTISNRPTAGVHAPVRADLQDAASLLRNRPAM